MYAARTALVAAAMLGCDPAGEPRDGGVRDDATAGTGSVRVQLGIEEDELPGEWRIEEAFVTLAEVRVDNDRGGELEPSWDAPGRLRLDEGAVEHQVEAAPATYGGVTLRSVDMGTVFDLALRSGDDEVRVVSRRAIPALALRCDEGAVSLRPGDEVALDATLDLTALVTRIADASLGDSVTIDEGNEPALLAELESIFDASWHLECEGDL